jgi:hypothetical protein
MGVFLFCIISRKDLACIPEQGLCVNKKSYLHSWLRVLREQKSLTYPQE